MTPYGNKRRQRYDLLSKFCTFALRIRQKEMANPFFRFKQFTVWHDRCTMKVGTDGCLLGAWVTIQETDRNLLDIGTGSGLIALMLAQRSNAQIDAIDIDAPSCQQAKENVARSPFAERIQVYHYPLSSFSPPRERRYDLIVSNPPYFIQSLKCPNVTRSQARHADSLPLPDLLNGSLHLLSDNGRLGLILPYDQRDLLLKEAIKIGLYPLRETQVSSRVDLPPKRLLIELGKEVVTTHHFDKLAIEDLEHNFTPEFIAIERSFYLKM